MTSRMTFAVLGGGNGAFAAAADLTLKGYSVRLLEVPELAEKTIVPIQEKGGIELVNPGVEAISPSGFATLNLITTDPQAALDGVDIVLYIVPAFAESRFTELCMPYFRPEQTVIFFCGNLGGALELASQLKSQQRSLPVVAETEGLVYGAFKQDPVTIKVGGYKAGLACSALPAARVVELLQRLRPVFPDFRPAAHVLETGLRNLNPVVHAPVSIVNAGRTALDKPKWRYYWEGVTEPVGRLIEAVDRERLAVAARIGLTLPTTLEVLLTWYGNQGAQGKTLAEVMSTNPAYEIAWAPQTLDHRFVTEDVPFGLVPIEALATRVGIETPIISALVTLASNLLDIDFRRHGRHLSRLGLDDLDSQEIESLMGITRQS